ncbi:hypothetical protein MHH81_03780 [Psychrobacillus sp. FSL H8-0484]|uniref:hypothetical protein n=1 Tax=Psychrobacillus sp. FSL H8-0484 TaxID=2921390 RepID=UPI0030F66CF4
MMMLKGKKRAMLIGGVAGFAFMYLYKMENRETAKVTMKNTKTKVSSYVDSRKHQPTQMMKAGHSHPHDPDDNRMVEEGSMYSVRYYNEKVQDSNGQLDFPKSQKKKLPSTKESLPKDNNESPAKQENTDRDPTHSSNT